MEAFRLFSRAVNGLMSGCHSWQKWEPYVLLVIEVREYVDPKGRSLYSVIRPPERASDALVRRREYRRRKQEENAPSGTSDRGLRAPGLFP